MKSIVELLFVLFNPAYWLMNTSYNRVWDAKLNKLMQEHKFTEIDTHTAKIGGITVWIANHPYASFTPCGVGMINNIRPSRRTIRRAMNKLVDEAITA